jgi:hypothetical protein
MYFQSISYTMLRTVCQELVGGICSAASGEIAGKGQ